MLSLSQTTGYAVLALACLCQGGMVLAKDIAACTGIPLPYLLKLLNLLGRSGLIVAKRGYRGGFALARPPSKINLLQIAEAVEGRPWLPRCLLGLEECSDLRRCPTHDFWSIARRRIERELRRTNLQAVADFERRHSASRLGTCGPAVGGAARPRGGRIRAVRRT